MRIFTPIFFRQARPLALAATALLAALALPGCGKRKLQVYTAPKEIPYVPVAKGQPAINYTLPAGWTELGGKGIVIAQFQAGDAKITVTSLGSMAGKESGLVNMYRQIGNQLPLDDAGVAKALTDLPVAGGTGKFFEVAGKEEGAAKHMVVAFLHRANDSLFFTLDGPEAPVTAQKPAFLEFVKTVVVAAATPRPPAAATGHAEETDPAPPPTPDTPDTPPTPPVEPKALPAGWTRIPHGDMQLAKFQVPEISGAKAEVSVSVFPSESGGTAANVRRWRGQLGLPEIDDLAAVASAKPIEGAPPGSLAVFLENGAVALTAAVVPRAGQWWFYKLTGDTPAVQAARESFLTFVKLEP